MMKRWIGALLVAGWCGAVLIAWTDGPLTPIMNLGGRTDENGYLRVSGGTPGATDGPLTPIGQLRGRNDENGYLRVSLGGAQTVSVPGIAVTSTNGLNITNPTASTAGVTAQYSPSQTFCGTAWKSNATAVSEVDCWRIENRPVTGAAATTSALWFSSSIAGAAYIDQMWLRNDGTMTLLNSSLSTVGLVTSSGTNISMGASPVFSFATPTISSGFGTSPSVTAGRATAFRVNVGTGGTASSGVIAVQATATTGWNCHAQNITGQAANRADQSTVQTASTTTTVTVQNQTRSTGAALAWTASDILAVSCVGF